MSANAYQYSSAKETIQPVKTRSLASYILVLGALIFLTHVVSILVLDFLNIHTHLLEIAIDAVIMLALLMPGLYFLQTKPLLEHIRERTQMEQTLRANEALFRKVLDLLPVGVGIVDQGGRLVLGNPAGEQIWGGLHYVGFDHLSEYKVFSLETGEPIRLEERAIGKAIRSGETTLNQEVEIEAFDGQRKILLNSAVPILGEQKDIQGAIIIQQDITSRKKAEQDLKQSEELFRTTVDTLPIGVWLADASGKIIYANPAGRQIWAGVRYVGIEEFGEYKGWWLDSGKPIHPDEWGIARAIHKQEISINEEIEIECFDGSHKVILNSAFPLYYQKKRVVGAYVTNQDITEQKLAAETLFRKNDELLKITAAEKKQRQLAEILTQSIIALNSSLELEHVINTLLDHLGRIALADLANVLLFEDEARLEVNIWRGYGEWEAHAVDAPIQVDELSELHFPGLQEFHQSIRLSGPSPLLPSLDPGKAEKIKEWLIIPIRTKDAMIGLVQLGLAEGKTFDTEQIQGMEALVSQATVVIQNARLFEQVSNSKERLQALAHKLVEIQENERSHIARELHDEAGQALSSLKISLSRLEQDPTCPPQIKLRLGDLKLVTDQILDELHHLAMDLRPVVLDHLGLVAALEQFTRELNSESLVIQFKSLGFDGERLSKEVETPLYRIVQEALTNVLRHASATHVGVLLERQGGTVRLFIEDNGVGLPSQLSGPNNRMGLVGMRERAEMLGGILTIESSPGRGTSIIVEVPDGNSNISRR